MFRRGCLCLERQTESTTFRLSVVVFLRERAAGLLRFTVSSVDRGLGVVCVYVYIVVHPLRITLTLFFVGYIDAVLDDRSTACSRLRGSCYVSCGSLGRKDGRTEERP